MSDLTRDAASEVSPSTRREWMRALAVGGSVSALAGCLGGGDDDNGDENGNGGNGGDDGTGNGGTDGDIDEYFVVPAIGNLEQVHFNMWSLDSNTFYENRLLWDGLAHYSAESIDWYPQLAEDWAFDIDDGTVSFDIREGIEWHDGTPFTADHAVNHFRLAEVWGDQVWDFATDVHAPEEYRFEFEIDPVAQSIIEPVFLGDNWAHWLHTHPELHAEFIERTEDATDDDELEDINADLASYSIEPEEAIEEGVGHGPVELVEVTDSRIVMEPYDGYPVGWDDGNDMNWAGFEVIDFGDSETDFHQAAIADNIDGFTGDTASEVREQMGDHWEILHAPQDGFQTIQFSPETMWGEDTAESRALRQAIAYMYDPTEYVQIFGEDMMDFPDPNNVTGMNTPQDNEWLADFEGLTNYGNSDSGWVQEELAEQKMEEAGFERDGDDWIDADTGDPLEVEIQYPVNWDANVPSYQNVVEQFNRFGIDADGIGEDSTTLQTQLMPDHDFEIAVFSSSLGPHPLAAYRNSIGNVSAPDTTRWNNQISEVEVPWPPGDEENDLETVSIDDRIEDLGNATSDEDVQELVEELAWIYNQWVHGVQVATEFRINYVATDTWDYGVDMDDPVIVSEQPWTQLSRTGDMRGRSE